tara:strand:+ start:661 stop:1080 length:420 start_codon:yes stop_codon:yes gene_type:complete
MKKNLGFFFKFHHFGLAIKNSKVAINFYKNLGYTISREYIDKFQRVRLRLCYSKLGPTIELVSPMDKKSPIINYIRKFDEVFYHTCYEINDLRAVEYLKENFDSKCVLAPRPAEIFGYKKISFYYVKNLGLIEILENVR